MRGTTEGDWLSQLLVPRSEIRWLNSMLPLSGSLLLHGLLAVPLVLVSFLPRAEAKPPLDAWAGDTFEVAMVGQPVSGGPSYTAPDVAPVTDSEPLLDTTGPGAEEAPADLAAEAQAMELARREAAAKRAAAVKAARAERRAREAKRRAREVKRNKSARKNGVKPSSSAPPKGVASRSKPAPSEPASSTATDDAKRSAAGERPGEVEGSGSDDSGRGSLGAAGLPRGVRQLPTAFTRVLPRAAVGDSRFLERGPGEVGDIRFTLHLDSVGKIERAEYTGTPDALLKSLIERALRFLGKGQFALKENPGEDLQGTQGVKVHLELKQTSPTPDTDEPSATRSLGFKPPRGSGKRIGFGYFELESGLRFEAEITFE